MSDGKIVPLNKMYGLGDSSSARHGASAKKTAAGTEARDPRLEQVSQLYEKQFLREMVKAMRSTVSEGGALKANMAEKIYREELDNEYVEAWGAQGGIGLADMIYNELNDKILSVYGGQKKWKPDGPLNLSNKDISQVLRTRSKIGTDGGLNTSSNKGQTASLRVELGQDSAGPAQVRTPWAGQILSLPRLDNGQMAAVLEHQDGVRSTFVFQGLLDPGLKAGDQLERGSLVGTLSPGIDGFFWNLQGSTQPPDGKPGL